MSSMCINRCCGRNTYSFSLNFLTFTKHFFLRQLRLFDVQLYTSAALCIAIVQLQIPCIDFLRPHYQLQQAFCSTAVFKKQF